MIHIVQHLLQMYPCHLKKQASWNVNVYLEFSLPPASWVLLPDQDELSWGQGQLFSPGSAVWSYHLGDLWVEEKRRGGGRDYYFDHLNAQGYHKLWSQASDWWTADLASCPDCQFSLPDPTTREKGWKKAEELLKEIKDKHSFTSNEVHTSIPIPYIYLNTCTQTL